MRQFLYVTTTATLVFMAGCLWTAAWLLNVSPEPPAALLLPAVAAGGAGFVLAMVETLYGEGP